MKSDSTSKISKKLFIGMHLDSEKRMLLSQSAEWKQVKISPQRSEDELTEVHHQGNDFLGLYLPEAVTLSQLHTATQVVQERMKVYCPKCEQDRMKISAFAQVFIA